MHYWCTAVIRGITYSHAPPCDDSNHQVWIPDPVTGGGSTGGGSTGGSSGGSTGGGSTGGGSTGGGTPVPQPTPQEIKSQKRTILLSKTGSAKSKTASLSKSGTTVKLAFGYTGVKKTPPRPVVKPSGGKSFTAYTGANKQAAMKQDFMKPTPKVNTSQSKAKKQAGKPLLQAAKGVYNFFIGDNIKTLRNPNASLLAKSVAAIDLIGMAIPGGLLVKSGAKLAIKGSIKAAKYLKEPAKAVAREAKKKATEAVNKAWGFAKGLFGGGKKSKTTSSNTYSINLDLQMFGSNKGTDKAWKDKIVLPSKPHANKTPGHWFASMREAVKEVKKNDTTKVYLNKGLQNEMKGAKRNRPDVMVVK